MASPESAYRTQALKTNFQGVTVSHRLAIPNEDTETLKSRFHLDYLLLVQTANGVGFIGGCWEDSANSKLHAPVRRGQLRGYFNGPIVYYTDAGLNCYGEHLGHVVNSDYIGDVVVTIYVKAAYYTDTTDIGVLIRVLTHPDGGVQVAEEISDMLRIEAGTSGYADFDILYITQEEVVAGDVLEITPFTINSEGRNEGEKFQVTVKMRTIELSRSAYGTPKTYYMNSLGITYAKNEPPFGKYITQLFTINQWGEYVPVVNGAYYIPDSSNYYLIEPYTSSSYGYTVESAFISLTRFDVTPEWSEVKFNGYFPSDACTAIQNGINNSNENPPIYIPLYFNSTQRKYFRSRSYGAQLAPDGYYSIGYGTYKEDWIWYKLENGAQVASGTAEDCPYIDF